jgi:hypothetical protein
MSETDLIGRLEKLERDNRRLKGSALAALVLATALATIYAAQPVPQTITAHEFNVVDSSGGVRVIVGTFSGKPGIAVFDPQHKPHAIMVVEPSGKPEIILGDLQGPRVGMMVDLSDRPNIALEDAQGRPRAVMALDSSGGPNISLFDPQGELRAGMVVSPGGPNIALWDAQGRVIWRAQ